MAHIRVLFRAGTWVHAFLSIGMAWHNLACSRLDLVVLVPACAGHSQKDAPQDKSYASPRTSQCR